MCREPRVLGSDFQTRGPGEDAVASRRTRIDQFDPGEMPPAELKSNHADDGDQHVVCRLMQLITPDAD